MFTYILLIIGFVFLFKAAEMLLSQGKITVDLARDFLDYFVFAGTGSKIAQRFGLSDISFTCSPYSRFLIAV